MSSDVCIVFCVPAVSCLLLPLSLIIGLGYLASNIEIINAMTEHLCKQAVSEVDCLPYDIFLCLTINVMWGVYEPQLDFFAVGRRRCTVQCSTLPFSEL